LINSLAPQERPGSFTRGHPLPAEFPDCHFKIPLFRFLGLLVMLFP